MLPTSGGQGRFSHIDALRGLAALAVAYFHFFGVLVGGSEDVSLLDVLIKRAVVEWIDLGRAAVLLFFVISGYVVARSVRSAPSHHVARFAIRRLFRLYPMYWAALGIYLLWTGTYGFEDVWRNLVMIQVPAWPPLTVVSVAWTMTVEVVFYALCTGLFLLGVLQRPAGLAAVSALFLGLAVVSAVGRTYFSIDIPFEWPLFLSLMFAGALLRELDERGTARRGVVVAIAAAVYLPIILSLSWLMFADETIHQKTWYRHFNAYAVAIAAFLAVHYFWRIRSRLLAYLGRIRYRLRNRPKSTPCHAGDPVGDGSRVGGDLSHHRSSLYRSQPPMGDGHRSPPTANVGIGGGARWGLQSGLKNHRANHAAQRMQVG